METSASTPIWKSGKISTSSSSSTTTRSATMLGPGFRFHPTDEELVSYYLKRKISGKPLRFDAISQIDIYKSEPWDLPCTILNEDEISITSTTLPASERFLFILQTYSPLHVPTAAAKELPFLDLWLLTRDLEWYFFSLLDHKFGNKARTNRATEKGYWKTTGKDRAIYHKKQIVGMKKTLVYHNGRAPNGLRSNWVMHEYRMADVELEKLGAVQDAFVLCRVFQKSGSGPKNGEQYGAPFVEEEWEEDDAPNETAGVLDFGDDDCLNTRELEQILQTTVSSDATPLSGFQSSDGSTIEETTELGGNQELTVPAGKQYIQLEQPYDKFSCGMLTPYNMEDKPSKHDYTGESSNSGSFEDLNFLLDEPFLDAFDNLEDFIETNDIFSPVQTNASAPDMFDEYLTFVDANDNSPYFTYDSAVVSGSNGLTSDQVLLSQKESFPGTEEAFLPSGELIYGNTNDASNKQEFARGQSDTFVKKASEMLGSIPAPPAFAAEFPLKDAVYQLSSVARSSSSVHVNAGSRKHGNFRLILSFGFAHGDDGSASLESRVSLFPGKNDSSMLSGWFCFMFMLVLILAMSFKLGAYICAN